MTQENDKNTKDKSTAVEKPAKAGVITKADIEKNKVWAVVSYLGIIGVIIVMVSEGKDSPYVKFHLNQALPLAIAWFGFILFMLVPIIGWLLLPIYNICVLILAIMGLINAAQGNVKRLPIVGGFEMIK